MDDTVAQSGLMGRRRASFAFHLTQENNSHAMDVTLFERIPEMKVDSRYKRVCGSTTWSKHNHEKCILVPGVRVVYLRSDAAPEVGVERARLQHGRHQRQVLSHQQTEQAGVGQQVVAVHKLQRHSHSFCNIAL